MFGAKGFRGAVENGLFPSVVDVGVEDLQDFQTAHGSLSEAEILRPRSRARVIAKWTRSRVIGGRSGATAMW